MEIIVEFLSVFSKSTEKERKWQYSMKKDKVKIKYQMVKPSGKEESAFIEFELPDKIVYRILKGATNKEELMVYCLVDILAKLQGYASGRFDGMEVEE